MLIYLTAGKHIIHISSIHYYWVKCTDRKLLFIFWCSKSSCTIFICYLILFVLIKNKNNTKITLTLYCRLFKVSKFNSTFFQKYAEILKLPIRTEQFLNKSSKLTKNHSNCSKVKRNKWDLHFVKLYTVTQVDKLISCAFSSLEEASYNCMRNGEKTLFTIWNGPNPEMYSFYWLAIKAFVLFLCIVNPC